MRLLLGLACIAIACISCGCRDAPLAHPIDCRAAIQLRLGQSPDKVRALLGAPRREGASGTIWRDGRPRTDYFFGYGAERHVTLAYRDEMRVDFLRGQLVEVYAYRMPVHVINHGTEQPALMLGSRDYGYQTEPFHTIGPAFTAVFTCPSGFNLDAARLQFETADTR